MDRRKFLKLSISSSIMLVIHSCTRASSPEKILTALTTENTSTSPIWDGYLTMDRDGLFDLPDFLNYKVLITSGDDISSNDVKVLIYEPNITNNFYKDYEVVNDLSLFARNSDIIIANRMSKEIKDYRTKIFSRDIFGEN